ASTEKKLAPLKVQLGEVAAQFDDLARNQKILGFTEEDGVRDRMTKSAAAVERIIHEDISWMGEADERNLLISLLTMRRFEAEYLLTHSTLMQSLFFDESKHVKKVLGNIVAAAVLKGQLARQVQTYSDTFAEWIDRTDKIGPPVAVIEYNVKGMIPIAEEIIASAKI